MKILSISNIDLWPRGENKGIPSIYASQKGFAQKGHKVYFLCLRQRRDLPLKEEYEGINIYRFRLPFNINSLSVEYFSLTNAWSHIKSTLIFNLEWFFFQIYSLIWGIRLARRIKPDLIYAHGLNAAFPAYLVSRIFKSKFIIRVYGTRELYWQWDNFWLRIKEFRDFLSFKIPADYFIITKDGNYGDRLARKLGVSEDKIKIWRNGVDFNMYIPNHQELKKEVLKGLKIFYPAKIIISTTRLIPLYGVDRLIYALPELFKKDKNSICLILGDGSEKEKLENFTREYNLQSRVLFLGMVDRDKLKILLNAADIFVLLSRYHNCTNTMWEAMVCGKCILTMENEAIKEVLSSRENAVLLSPENIKMLPAALDELLQNDKLREELGAKAHLKAQEVLESWEKRIQREIELLEGLVKG